MWRHTAAVKCTLEGDFTTYPALICPLCNGYQGLSGNGVIKKKKKKQTEGVQKEAEDGGREERDRKVEGDGS